MKEEKISFSQLTWPIKTAVVMAWFVGIMWVIVFSITIIYGIEGVI